MLTRELAIVEYEGSRAIPDRLCQKRDGHYVDYARRMCDLYAKGVGRTRQELHRDVHSIFSLEPNCPPRRIDAFCKLLDEASEYQRDSAGSAAKLRTEVFRRSAAMHPLVTTEDAWFQYSEKRAKESIAEQLKTTWDEIDKSLFSDIIEFHRLIDFQGYKEPAQLLSRYNVAQTQVALFDATRMTIWATEDFKSILRYAKLARLMHTIARVEEDLYRFDFNGPASLFSHTHRYGVAMARFLPGLLSCRGWRMQAQLRPSQWKGRVNLELEAGCGLSSPVPGTAEFDSQLEKSFFERWGNEAREGWRLKRETEILQRGQSIFMPDFVLTHESGRKVLLEVIGFWTPEYLQKKKETLGNFRDQPILLAVADIAKEKFIDDHPDLFLFKTVIRVDAVLERLRNVSVRVG